MESLTLIIQNLEFETIIGILDFERKNPQKILLEGEFTYNYKEKGFIDYVMLKNFIKQLLEANQYGLLEEALLDIIKNLKQNFDSISSVCLTLKKLHIINDCIVGVKINKIF
ncbi:hypothetical protein BKH41_01975 [Helicobacter sp. 12S02232-10]|uniref:dihydroneopterin aldolase n=1 Tax=Helicobacter sp. 12S02232-10 TaxID=1476197 RepID=UPI000BA67CE7|nr:dihydroneopterin aldolase [Helicobacter sp. 12S02232-10]PAF49454.1 hypothetical protein BKH41_01975 [Helicobacter sp. 12S02232-10]